MVIFHVRFQWILCWITVLNRVCLVSDMEMPAWLERADPPPPMSDDERRSELDQWLRMARYRHNTALIIVARVYQHAEALGLSLEDAGTSEEELRGVVVGICDYWARSWLRIARAGNLTVVKSLVDRMEDGGLSPSDIGATQAEIDELVKRSQA